MMFKPMFSENWNKGEINLWTNTWQTLKKDYGLNFMDKYMSDRVSE